MQNTETPSVSSPAPRISGTSTGDETEGFSLVQDPRKALHKLSMDPAKPADTEWTRRYRAHLDSPKWQQLREKVWDRENGLCEGCRGEPIEHVHHLTYANMGDELLFELKGLCLDCHLKVHRVQKFKQGLK